MDKLRRFADKRFGETVFAEEAYTVAFDRLIDPEWQEKRLSRFKGGCSPRGFVFSVYRSLLEDYSRSKYGRPRPPAWLQRLGPLWIKIFKLLCLERLETEGIISRLQQEITEGVRDIVEGAVALILSKVSSCGEKSGEVPHDFSESESGGWPDGSDKYAVEASLDRESLETICRALRVVLGDGADDSQLPSDLEQSAASFSLDLEPEEKLLLRMVYQDGISIVAAARMLGRPDHTVRRKVKAAVCSVREQLEDHGISNSVLGDLLGQ